MLSIILNEEMLHLAKLLHSHYIQPLHSIQNHLKTFHYIFGRFAAVGEHYVRNIR